LNDIWKYYTVKDGLAGNSVLSLAKDRDTLWIGGKSTITKFNLSENTFEKFVIPVDFENVSSLAVNNRYVWAADGDYRSKPLVVLDKEAKNRGDYWAIIPNKDFNARHVNTLATDGKYLWIGTDDGVRQYDFETKECSSITTGLNSITGNVKSIIVTEDFVWFGAARFACYDKADRSCNVWLKGQQSICYIAADGEDFLMSTSGNSQVVRFNPDTEKWTVGIQRQFIGTNSLFDILVDGKYVWVATAEGIDRFNKRNLNWDHFTEEQGLHGNSVGSLVSCDNEILTGVWRHGTSSFDCKNSRFIPFTSDKEQIAEELMPLLTDGNTIWFQFFSKGSYSGLKKYDALTKKWSSFSESSGLLHNRIYSMAVDDKYVWIGTMNGVNRYDKTLQKLETFLEPRDVTHESDNLTYALQPDGDDIWISIRNKGLFKYNKKTGQGKLYLEEKHPAPYTYDSSTCWVENIQLDKNYLYLATNKGLIIYDKNNDEWFNFNFDEFLGWAWLNNIRIDGDFLWLGSRSWGLARFDKKLWLEYNKLFPLENK
jgi:ligand-binding sensor domain-containing protein